MSLGLDLKWALPKNRNPKVADQQRSYGRAEINDAKARHILGLDTTHSRHAGNNNNHTNSSSTPKLKSVTFSNATTAAESTSEASNNDRETLSALSHKSSSTFLRKNRKPELQITTLKPKGSSSSLRSFYDKTRTPLSVSQQTSDSSSRDFALRKGAPSVLSVSTQGTAHSRQVRLLTKPQKSASERSRFSPSVTKLSNSSSRSPASSLHETVSDTAESFSSQPSTSRISILRNAAQARSNSPTSAKHSPTSEHPFPMVKPVADPARAKINIRRPKAGTKNWFDSLESDSSDDEDVSHEPQFAADIALEMTNGLPDGEAPKIPPRNSSFTAEIPKNNVQRDTLAKYEGVQQSADQMQGPAHIPAYSNPTRKRKVGMFENVDLTQESVLYLGSSDDEDDSEPCSASSEHCNSNKLHSSLMSGPWDNAHVEVCSPIASSPLDSERILRQLKHESLEKPPIPERSSHRMITYLEDCSTETVTQQDEILTCFPRTPTTESQSLNPSLRESVLSEDESVTSTKLMPVTRQEESLIAAMRLKKTAMRRAQTTAHRQSALKILEREHSHSPSALYENLQADRNPSTMTFDSPLRQPNPRAFTSLPHQSQRTDSVTTFQTDSVRQQSVRSSIATYLSEGSEDLQLPYSSIYGLPMGSSQAAHIAPLRSDKPRRSRDTFLSEMSTTSTTYAASASEWSSNARDSHVVELDPLERQMLREEIPSQLFMERPFLGWEARANMQTAH